MTHLSLGGKTARLLKSSAFQTGEYATDEEEDEVGPVLPDGDMAIEVFELPENEDMFSPSDLDTSKLSHKFKEVTTDAWDGRLYSSILLLCIYLLNNTTMLRTINFQMKSFNNRSS